MPIQNVFRNLSTQSVTLGSSAAGTTAVFGSQTYQVRLCSNQFTKYVIGNTALTTSTQLLTTGASLPANTVEYVRCSPGQLVSAITTSTAADFTVTEQG